jgi:XRE family transcriptional regulator, aerobic/anaerobic benzoate catabolism transcriptional regulator
MRRRPSLGATADGEAELSAIGEPRAGETGEYLVRLGARVREMRALRGMSRKTLAAASGVSERYIARLESGQGNGSILLLRRVAAAMGSRVEDLVREPSADAPEWLVVRDLLRSATPAQITQARAVLSGARLQPGGHRPVQRFALIGLRGAGKSTLGRMAANRLGWPFLELNKEIERQNGLSIPEIFAIYGQEGYRRFEQSCLKQLIDLPGPLVLATGGGIVAEPLTYDLLLSSFFTIWLKALPEEHMARVRAQGDLRPMADDRSAMQELRAILTSREPFYARADAIIDTAGATPEAAAARLCDLLRNGAPHEA